MTSHVDELSASVIDAVVTAAQYGWSPDDLRHVLGAYSYPSSTALARTYLPASPHPRCAKRGCN